MSDCQIIEYETLFENLSPSGSFSGSVYPIGHDDEYDQDFLIIGEDTLGNKYCEKKTISWVWPIYHGVHESPELNGPEIALLNKTLTKQPELLELDFIGEGYKYIAIPTNFESFAVAKEKVSEMSVALESDDIYNEGAEESYSYKTVYVVNAYGVGRDYKVYRSENYLFDNKKIVLKWP